MTIHRVLNLTLPDLNRALELIQKQTTNQVLNPTNISSSPMGGAGVSTSGTSIKGDKGDKGETGADGIANLDLIVVDLTETEDIIMDESGNVVSDEAGLGVTGVHTDWDIVEDQYGAIITAE